MLKLSTVTKYNHNHDKEGKFSTAEDAVEPKTNTVGVQVVGGKKIRVETSREGAEFIHQQRQKAKEIEKAIGAEPPKEGERGSRSKPIHCGADIEKAAKLIAQGKHVTLDQPEQVSTLVSKIKNDADALKAKGVPPEEWPNWNIAAISVKGTNLFAIENLDIPRVLMPQFSGAPLAGSKAEAKLKTLQESKPDAKEVDMTPEFIQSMKDAGVKSETVSIVASHLKSTQEELDGAKVGGMAAKLASGGDLGKGVISVTRDGYIIDGHHRWAATVVNDLNDNHPGDLSVEVVKFDIDIGTALSRAVKFQEDVGLPFKSVPQGKQPIAPKKKRRKMEDLAEVLKFNPYHDEKGRFTTSETGTVFSRGDEQFRRTKPDGTSESWREAGFTTRASLKPRDIDPGFSRGKQPAPPPDRNIEGILQTGRAIEAAQARGEGVLGQLKAGWRAANEHLDSLEKESSGKQPAPPDAFQDKGIGHVRPVSGGPLKTRITPTEENAKARENLHNYMGGFYKKLKNDDERAYVEERVRQILNNEKRPHGMSGRFGISKQKAIALEIITNKVFKAGRKQTGLEVTPRRKADYTNLLVLPSRKLDYEDDLSDAELEAILAQVEAEGDVSEEELDRLIAELNGE